MDISSDFIRPEFFNILFVQQKNLVIFPYVDLKLLKALELFAEGFTVVDVDSTALNDMKEIIEFEANNSYSQNKLFFFITNVGKKELQKIINLENLHCIINSNEDISELANGSKFIFFNKKHGQFVNYEIEEKELEFEKDLMTKFEDEALQEQVHQIKIIASKMYREINNTGDLDKISEILSKYDKSQKYWNSILSFTSNYYDIMVPDIKDLKVIVRPRKILKDFSNEYEILITTNKAIGREFIQQLHEYRYNKVNAQNLELEELYNPLLLYNYLRNHHWDKGIPEDFITTWAKMGLSRYTLAERDQEDFNSILEKLHIPIYFTAQSISQQEIMDEDMLQVIDNNIQIPSLHTNWDQFCTQLLSRLNNIDFSVRDLLKRPSESYTYSKLASLTSLICTEISELNHKLRSHRKTTKRTQNIIDILKEDISVRNHYLGIEEWIQLYGFKDRYTVVMQFFARVGKLHTKLFGQSNKKMHERLDDFPLPQNLNAKLQKFRLFRNELGHESIEPEKIPLLLQEKEEKINNTYIHFLAFLIKTYLIDYILIHKRVNNSPTLEQEIIEYIMKTYLNNGVFAPQEVKKIQTYLFY